MYADVISGEGAIIVVIISWILPRSELGVLLRFITITVDITHEVSIIVSLFQMKKLEFRDVKYVAQVTQPQSDELDI